MMLTNSLTKAVLSLAAVKVETAEKVKVKTAEAKAGGSRSCNPPQESALW